MTAFPMFAERTKEGVYQQQDADECFQNLLQTFERIAITKVKKKIILLNFNSLIILSRMLKKIK